LVAVGIWFQKLPVPVPPELPEGCRAVDETPDTALEIPLAAEDSPLVRLDSAPDSSSPARALLPAADAAGLAVPVELP